MIPRTSIICPIFSSSVNRLSVRSAQRSCARVVAPIVCGWREVVFPDCATAQEKPITARANADTPHLTEDMQPTLSHAALGPWLTSSPLVAHGYECKPP